MDKPLALKLAPNSLSEVIGQKTLGWRRYDS